MYDESLVVAVDHTLVVELADACDLDDRVPQNYMELLGLLRSIDRRVDAVLQNKGQNWK